jgi:hypothetical protein
MLARIFMALLRVQVSGSHVSRILPSLPRLTAEVGAVMREVREEERE